jgi:homoserine/homoserine lactone efflux protein
MSIETYLSFVVASLVLDVIPGPTVLMVVGYALAQGRRSAWSTVTGVTLGNVLAITVCFLGLGTFLWASVTLFSVLKWIGAGYLVYLGIRMWREPAVNFAQATAPAHSSRQMLFQAWLVTALNPKGMVFYLAYIPQFIQPKAPLLPQLFLLGSTFVVLAAFNAGGYALLAGSVREALDRPGVRRWMNRTGGGLLIGAGATTALLRHGS